MIRAYPVRAPALLSAALGLAACGGGDDAGAGGGGGRGGAGSSRGGATSAGGAASAEPDRPGLGEPPPGDLSGSGGAPVAPGAMTCGASLCDPLASPVGERLAACCPTSDDADACGLDLGPLATLGISAAVACQERDQDGDVSSGCPGSAPVDLMGTASVTFEGCCRPDGRCGQMLDRVGGVLTLGLGCVANDVLPALAGPASCGDPAAGGAGGAGATDGGI